MEGYKLRFVFTLPRSSVDRTLSLRPDPFPDLEKRASLELQPRADFAASGPAIQLRNAKMGPVRFNPLTPWRAWTVLLAAGQTSFELSISVPRDRLRETVEAIRLTAALIRIGSSPVTDLGNGATAIGVVGADARFAPRFWWRSTGWFQDMLFGEASPWRAHFLNPSNLQKSFLRTPPDGITDLIGTGAAQKLRGAMGTDLKGSVSDDALLRDYAALVQYFFSRDPLHAYDKSASDLRFAALSRLLELWWSGEVSGGPPPKQRLSLKAGNLFDATLMGTTRLGTIAELRTCYGLDPVTGRSTKKEIVVLGDSLSDEQIEAGVWTRTLRKNIEGSGLGRIWNAAYGGGATRYIAADTFTDRSTITALGQTLAILTNPTVVVINTGVNNGHRGIALDETEIDLRTLVDASRKSGAHVVLVGTYLPAPFETKVSQATMNQSDRVAITALISAAEKTPTMDVYGNLYTPKDIAEFLKTKSREQLTSRIWNIQFHSLFARVAASYSNVPRFHFVSNFWDPLDGDGRLDLNGPVAGSFRSDLMDPIHPKAAWPIMERLNAPIEAKVRAALNATATLLPIALDLDGGGSRFVPLERSSARFDADGDGQTDRIAWVDRGTALLAFDKEGNGSIETADEISFVGYKPGAQTDLEGLAAFDTNRNDALDAGDVDWAKFGAWLDLDGDGVSDEGEYQSLDQIGITLIGLKSDGRVFEAANGDVTVYGTTMFQWADGRRGSAADAGFSFHPAAQPRKTTPDPM
jgi:hypothetical protein